MHILQLANFYGPRSGGLRTAVDELANRYAGAGHSCSLIIPDDHDGVRVTSGRTVVAVRSPLVPGTGGYRAIVDRRAVRHAIESLRPDVIELSDKTTLVAPAARARHTGTPVVLISHERLDAVVGQFIGGWIASRAFSAFNARLLRKVDAVVCASSFAAAEFNRADAAVLPHQIPLGVDLDLFRPMTSARSGSRRHIAAVVRLSPEKRPDVLIATSRCLAERGVDHLLTIYGDGGLRARLERSAGDLPVRFAGHLSDRFELAQAMARADVAIAPGPHETFGLAALEFLAAGTPVVVSKHGALSEVVTPDTGSAVELTGEAYAIAVERLLAGDRERQRTACRARAERFGWDHTAAEYLDLFERLVTASRPDAAPSA